MKGRRNGIAINGSGLLGFSRVFSDIHAFMGVIGAVVFILYGIIPTFQPAHFGLVYAAYGGMCIVLSLLLGWAMDRMSRIGSTTSEPYYGL